MEQQAVTQLAPDALNRIVELSDAVRAYRESMGGFVAALEKRRRQTTAILSELEKIVGEQERRLQEAIDHYGMHDTELRRRAVASFRFMQVARQKLHRLGLCCRAHADARLHDRVAEAVQAVRDQIAYAMDVRFAQ